MCESGKQHRRPSVRDFFANWREHDAAWPTKTRLAARNYWSKLRTASTCCGHEGEPGCCQVEHSMS
jgi:hypothetical protein